MRQFKSKLVLGVLSFLLAGVVLGGFVPAWAAQPILSHPLTDQSAIENIAFNFSFGVNAFVDGDGDTLTYVAQVPGGTPLPAWLSFDGATRTFSGTPSNGDVGNISIEVIASDGSLSVSDFFDITIYDEASAPSGPIVANPIPNQNATEDAAFDFQFAADTFEGGEETLTYSAQSAGGSALPAWLNFNGATRTLSGTPGNSDVGVISIDIIADDGNSGVVTDTFDIVIANTNDAPTVANAIPNQNATEDAAFNFQFAANTFNDADVGDTLTYSAQLAGGAALPSWLSFDPVTRTFSGTPANADVGTISIDVTASDGNGGSVTDTFNIVVSNINDAPTVANAIPNQNATEDAAFNFQFATNTFNDADVGDTLTYSAQLAGGAALPEWLTFNAVTRTFSGTPSNGDVGTVAVDVIADDGNGGTVTDTFSVVVEAANSEPGSTAAPIMDSPVSDTNYGLIPVNYELGEDPLVGSVTLTFIGSDTITINLNIGSPAIGPYQYFINPTNVMATGGPISSTSQNTIPNGTYTVVLSYQNANGDPAATAIATNVTINSEIIDTDADGSLDSVELAGPNNGDANDDSIADAEQANVISHINPVTEEYAVFATSCQSIEDFQVHEESLEESDNNFDYPMGLAGFRIICEDEGETATIQHYYYGVSGNSAYSVRKWSNGQYREIPDALPLGELIDNEVVFLVRYEITDGGEFDDDGEVNGVIVDPSGAALPQESINTPSPQDSSGGSGNLAATGFDVRTPIVFAVTLVALSLTLFITGKRSSV